MLRKNKNLIKNWITSLNLHSFFICLLHFPSYFLDWRRFVAQGGKASFLDSYPCLGDKTSQTSFDPHYFYQAAWLSRKLASSKPYNHVDIGSDIKAISVLSAFVPVEFLDFRPLNVNISGLRCLGDDLLNLSRTSRSISSLSCMHVIEHVGLGRYGDPITPTGSLQAAKELERVISPGGRLYISVPVGEEKVCFNAHRIFDPVRFIEMFPELDLESFSFVDDLGNYFDKAEPLDAADKSYACGMYVFVRKS
ncbi:protein of unknown function, DUF268 [Thalassospira xiamenensis M-5 = DSM 17429]|nr:protein of unknown function, DUF268 [Thalassospira xiamenensis M-5 = DSM 17429]